MFFNSRLLVTFALFSLAGCSLYEGPPVPRKKEFSQGSLGCLKDMGAKLSLYFDGKGSAQDVNLIAECSINALRTFGELTRGENRDRFTAQEVRNFLQRYFLDDVKFSDSFLRELMRVKQGLVGGKETDFTREDLREAEGLINALRDVLLELRASMPISIDRVRRETPEYVDAEALAIERVGAILGRRITEKDSTYSFEEMGRLIDEVRIAFPAAAGPLAGMRENMKVAGILKEMLISPNRPRGAVTAYEWRLMFEDGSRWMGVYIKFLNLNAQNPDGLRGEGRTRLGAIANESIDLFDRVVARHCPVGSETSRAGCRVAPGIPFRLFREVLENLPWDGTIAGVKFEKSTLAKLIDPFFQRLFGGTDPTETGRIATRLTHEHLERVRKVIQETMDGARYVEGVYARLLRAPDFSPDAAVRTKDIVETDVRSVLRANGGVTEDAVQTALGLRESFSRTIALGDRFSPGAVFDGRNASRPRVFHELIRYVWLRPLLRLAVLGYMKGPEVTKREKLVQTDGVTREEFTDLIADYWPLLQDFKMVGRRNSPEGDAKHRFRETSLFMPVSDGNRLISIDEGVQLVLYMLSSNPLGREVHARAARLCRNGPPDDYGQPTIEPTCYRENILDFRTANPNGADLWTPFPRLVHFYESLSVDDQARMRRDIETAVRKAGSGPDDYFGSEYSDGIPMIFHYIETFFLMHDRNSDGFIDRTEAQAAFPVFRNELAELIGNGVSDAKLESIFTYLLAKGNPPISDEMGAWRRFWRSTGFLWWHMWNPNFRADRLKLIGVFAAISTVPPAPPKLAP